MAGASSQNSYDEVPYPSHAFRQTHPDRLATIGHLFGMQPTPIENCRVLEIGCAGGENLLPMAYHLPDSDFVGVDLSQVQIDAAIAKAREIGVRNISFLQADLRALPPDMGQFDYIISHGVYSWVPDQVQHALLEVCSNCLPANGIAYVSYNTYPGWHMRGMIRDMMNYRVRNLRTPADRIQRSRDLLRFLAGAVPLENNSYGMLLNGESNLLSRQGDSYLFHEHLEEHNSPLYFHQFVERVDAAGLQYLGEADFSMMFAENLPTHVEAELQNVATSLVEAEQYMDFVRNRTFRQSLLCHKSVALDRNLPATRVMPLYVSSPTRPKIERPCLDDETEMEFRCGDSVATTSDGVTKAALVHLGESWPRRHSMTELLEAARSKVMKDRGVVGRSSDEDKKVIAQALLGCFSDRHVELSVIRSTCESQVTNKPVASVLARRQASAGYFVTSEFHKETELREFERHVIQMLDGHHDSDLIVDRLSQLAASGMLELKPELRVASPDQIRQLVSQAVDSALKRFARTGLLVS